MLLASSTRTMYRVQVLGRVPEVDVSTSRRDLQLAREPKSNAVPQQLL
jgi:hypothetical protein